MILNSIKEYYYPKSIEEALELFHRHQGVAAYLWDGKSLIVNKSNQIKVIIDVNHLPLKEFSTTENYCSIGTGITLQSILGTKALSDWGSGILKDALAATGTWITRQGTSIGEVLSSKDPFTELLTALVTLDARIEAAGIENTTTILEFFSKQDEILKIGILPTAILLPLRWQKASGAFLKLSRIPSELPILTAGAVAIKNGTRCEDTRIVLGGSSKLPIQLPAVETSLRGKLLASTLIQQAVQSVSSVIPEYSDTRASYEYRTKVAPVLIRRVIEKCAASDKQI